MLGKLRLATVVLVAGCGGGASKPTTAPIQNSAEQDPPPFTGEATVVERTQTSGVIELSGKRDISMRSAMDQMTAHCGADQFTITSEGEEVIDQPTLQTAWRIRYVCNPR